MGGVKARQICLYPGKDNEKTINNPIYVYIRIRLLIKDVHMLITSLYNYVLSVIL